MLQRGSLQLEQTQRNYEGPPQPIKKGGGGGASTLLGATISGDTISFVDLVEDIFDFSLDNGGESLQVQLLSAFSDP